MEFTSSVFCLFLIIFILIFLVFKKYLKKTINKCLFLIIISGILYIYSSRELSFVLFFHLIFDSAYIWAYNFRNSNSSRYNASRDGVDLGISQNRSFFSDPPKLLFFLLVFCKLGVLAYFKYFDFLISIFQHPSILNSQPISKLPLPLGISFFTFQSIAFLHDLCYEKLGNRKVSILEYWCFLLFFPQLVAGPIVNGKDFLGELESPSEIVFEKTAIFYLLLGFSKKLIFADRFGEIANTTFQNPNLFSQFSLWLGSLAFSAQIYLDFSGYSDIAIGIALLVGIRLPINFNMPYLASSFSEFWRRWHITLSTWLKDYLYIPLGGNRFGVFTTYRNLFFVMLLGGLWHGANWTFLVWGILHGLFLGIERFCKTQFSISFPFQKVLSWAIILFSVNLTWVFFRAQNISSALFYLQKMFFGTSSFALNANMGMEMELGYTLKKNLMIGILFMVVSHFIGIFLFRNQTERLANPLFHDESIPFWALPVLAFFVIFLVLVSFGSYEFIYFVF